MKKSLLSSKYHPARRIKTDRMAAHRTSDRRRAAWYLIESSRGGRLGLLRLDYSLGVVQHTDNCLARRRPGAILRVRDCVANCVGSCIPDWTVSKPVAD